MKKSPGIKSVMAATFVLTREGKQSPTNVF